LKDPNKRYSASLLYEKLEKIKKIKNHNNTTSFDFDSFFNTLTLLSDEYVTRRIFDNYKNSYENNKSLDFIKKKCVVSNITPSGEVESHLSSSQISNNICNSEEIEE
jgi:hypothetical protein